MYLTNDIISKDASGVLLGEYLMFGLYVIGTIATIVGVISLIVLCAKKKLTFKEERVNIISLAFIVVLGVLFSFVQMKEGIMPLKADLLAQNWVVEKDVCTNKISGSTPNVEDYKLYYQKAGTKRVNKYVYQKTKIGVTDYIVTLSNGDELIYSSEEYQILE